MVIRMLQLTLTPDRSCVPRARHFVRDGVHRLDWHHGQDSAELLTSELVTNAIRHGSGEVSVSLSRENDLLRVRVTDDSRDAPVMAPPDPLAAGGRGLWLVDELSSDWGVATEQQGKTVWFELSRPA